MTSSPSSSSSDIPTANGLFHEPPDYYAPEKSSTTTTHTLPTGETLTLSLVGHNPLWGHHLFPASRVLATYLHAHAARLCKGKRVLELGAGAGLPGLAAARYGAKRVLITDYPDDDLIANIRANVEAAGSVLRPGRVETKGYIWGRDPVVLAQRGERKVEFDTVILSDLMFNHSQHEALVGTVRECLARREGSRALVFFTPHRPWLVERDLGLFEVLRDEGGGLVAEKVVEEKMERVMFEGDPGDEELRRTVWGWEVRWGDLGPTIE